MRRAFSLIEILVVITMLSILMMLIAPAGLKIVESVDRFVTTKNEHKEIDKLQFQAFLESKEINASHYSILKKYEILHISAKGIIIKQDYSVE
jgi:prepilin-type N-terminal cleavage/methylation domain-containing protein